jgi:hypothetical protein
MMSNQKYDFSIKRKHEASSENMIPSEQKHDPEQNMTPGKNMTPSKNMTSSKNMTRSKKMNISEVKSMRCDGSKAGLIVNQKDEIVM